MECWSLGVMGNGRKRTADETVAARKRGPPKQEREQEQEKEQQEEDDNVSEFQSSVDSLSPVRRAKSAGL